MAASVQNNFVFCPPLPGKLDPHRDPSSPNALDRVPLAPQKDNTCWYYSLKAIRDETNIGKHPSFSDSDTQMMATMIASRISSARKALTDYPTLCHGVKNIFDTLSESFAERNQERALQGLPPREGKMNKEQAQQFLGATETYIAELLTQSTTDRAAAEFDLKSQRLAINDFCEQNEFDDFMLYATHVNSKEHRILFEQRTFSQCLERFGDSKEKTEAAVFQILKDLGLPLEKDIIYHGVYCGLFKDICARTYGLKHSSWTPDQPIEALIDQLRTNGPHVVQGNIGRAFYTSPASKLIDTIEGRPVHTWKSQDFANLDGFGHSVIIVGAKVEGLKEYVYFLDPNDGSDPKNLPPVYGISYKKLRSQITDIYGLTYASPDDIAKRAFFGKYAFHR